MNQPEPVAPPSTIEVVLARLEAFAKANPHLDEEQIGWFALKEPGVMERLRRGGDIGTRKLDAVLAWLNNPVLTFKKGGQ